jgi:hypothetical protein
VPGWREFPLLPSPPARGGVDAKQTGWWEKAVARRGACVAGGVVEGFLPCMLYGPLAGPSDFLLRAQVSLNPDATRRFNSARWNGRSRAAHRAGDSSLITRHWIQGCSGGSQGIPTAKPSGMLTTLRNIKRKRRMTLCKLPVLSTNSRSASWNGRMVETVEFQAW